MTDRGPGRSAGPSHVTGRIAPDPPRTHRNPQRVLERLA